MAGTVNAKLRLYPLLVDADHGPCAAWTCQMPAALPWTSTYRGQIERPNVVSQALAVVEYLDDCVVWLTNAHLQQS
jgi:hypothetical protein